MGFRRSRQSGKQDASKAEDLNDGSRPKHERVNKFIHFRLQIPFQNSLPRIRCGANGSAGQTVAEWTKLGKQSFSTVRLRAVEGNVLQNQRTAEALHDGGVTFGAAVPETQSENKIRELRGTRFNGLHRPWTGNGRHGVPVLQKLTWKWSARLRESSKSPSGLLTIYSNSLARSARAERSPFSSVTWAKSGWPIMRLMR
jgi:hypothetical protein